MRGLACALEVVEVVEKTGRWHLQRAVQRAVLSPARAGVRKPLTAAQLSSQAAAGSPITAREHSRRTSVLDAISVACMQHAW